MFRGGRISLGKSMSGSRKGAVDPDYEEVGPPTNFSRITNGIAAQPSSPSAAPVIHCDLCGSAVASVRCLKCNSQAFCNACDDMYHRHPRRALHDRKSLNVNGGGPLRPPLPPKGPELPPSTTQQHIPPPQPPPRKNKSRGSFFPTPNIGRKDQVGTDPSSAGRSLMGSLKRIMGNRPLPAPPNQNNSPFTGPPSTFNSTLPRSSTAPSLANQRPSLPSSLNQSNSSEENFRPGIMPSRSMPPTPPSALAQYPRLQPKGSAIGSRKMSLQHLPQNFDDKRQSMVEPSSVSNAWDAHQNQALQPKNRSQSISDEQWNQVIALQNPHNHMIPNSHPGYPSSAASEVGGVNTQRNFNTLGRSSGRTVASNLNRGMVSSASVCDLNTLAQQHQIQQQQQHQQQQQLVPAYPNMQSANSFQQLNMMGGGCDGNMMWMPCTGCQAPPMGYPVNHSGMKRTASNLSMNLSSVGSDVSGYPWAPHNPHMHHPMPMYPGGYYPGSHPPQHHMGPMSAHSSGMSIPSSPGPSLRSSSHRSQKSSKSKSFSTADLSGRRSRAHSRRRGDDSEDSITSASDDEHIKMSSKLGKSGGLAWQCDHCTFINPGHVDSCGMCSKTPGRTNEKPPSRKTPHSERRRTDKRSTRKSERDDDHQLSDDDGIIKNGKSNRRERYKPSGSMSMSNKSRRKSLHRRGSSCSPSSGSGSDVEDEAARLERQLKELRISSRSRNGRDYDRMSVTSRTKDTGSLKREGGGRYRNRAKYHSERSRTPGGHSPPRRSISRKPSTESDDAGSKSESSSPGQMKPEKSSQEGTLVGTVLSDTLLKENTTKKLEGVESNRYKHGRSRASTPGPIPSDFNVANQVETDEQDIVSEAENIVSDDEVFIDDNKEEKKDTTPFVVKDHYAGFKGEPKDNNKDLYRGLKPEMAYGDAGHYKTDVEDPSFANTLDDVVTLATHEVADIDPNSQNIDSRPTSADLREHEIIEEPVPVANYIKPSGYEDVKNDDIDDNDDVDIDLIEEAIKTLKQKPHSPSPEVPDYLLPLKPGMEMPSISLAFEPSYEPIADPMPQKAVNDNFDKNAALTLENTYQSFKTPLATTIKDEKSVEPVEEEPLYVNEHVPSTDLQRQNSLEEDMPVKILAGTNSTASLNDKDGNNEKRFTPLSFSSSDAQFYSPPDSPELSLSEKLGDKNKTTNQANQFEDIVKDPDLSPEGGYETLPFQDAVQQHSNEAISIAKSASDQAIYSRWKNPPPKFIQNDPKKTWTSPRVRQEVKDLSTPAKADEEVDEDKLTVEDLIKRRKQKAMKKDGMELVRIIRDAEEAGYDPEEVSIAMTLGGEAIHPLVWLEDNWKHMVDTVLTLATNYGHERKVNDIGDICAKEAKLALRIHKGNIWAAVTECVEQRQKKYLEIDNRGKFERVDIVKTLTEHEGDLESAFLELNRSKQMGSFMSKIWAPFRRDTKKELPKENRQVVSVEKKESPKEKKNAVSVEKNESPKENKHAVSIEKKEDKKEKKKEEKKETSKEEKKVLKKDEKKENKREERKAAKNIEKKKSKEPAEVEELLYIRQEDVVVHPIKAYTHYADLSVSENSDIPITRLYSSYNELSYSDLGKASGSSTSSYIHGGHVNAEDGKHSGAVRRRQQRSTYDDSTDSFHSTKSSSAPASARNSKFIPEDEVEEAEEPANASDDENTLSDDQEASPEDDTTTVAVDDDDEDESMSVTTARMSLSITDSNVDVKSQTVHTDKVSKNLDKVATSLDKVSKSDAVSEKNYTAQIYSEGSVSTQAECLYQREESSQAIDPGTYDSSIYPYTYAETHEREVSLDPSEGGKSSTPADRASSEARSDDSKGTPAKPVHKATIIVGKAIAKAMAREATRSSYRSDSMSSTSSTQMTSTPASTPESEEPPTPIALAVSESEDDELLRSLDTIPEEGSELSERTESGRLLTRASKNYTYSSTRSEITETDSITPQMNNFGMPPISERTEPSETYKTVGLELKASLEQATASMAANSSLLKKSESTASSSQHDKNKEGSLESGSRAINDKSKASKSWTPEVASTSQTQDRFSSVKEVQHSTTDISATKPSDKASKITKDTLTEESKEELDMAQDGSIINDKTFTSHTSSIKSDSKSYSSLKVKSTKKKTRQDTKEKFSTLPKSSEKGSDSEKSNSSIKKATASSSIIKNSSNTSSTPKTESSSSSAAKSYIPPAVASYSGPIYIPSSSSHIYYNDPRAEGSPSSSATSAEALKMNNSDYESIYQVKKNLNNLKEDNSTISTKTDDLMKQSTSSQEGPLTADSSKPNKKTAIEPNVSSPSSSKIYDRVTKVKNTSVSHIEIQDAKSSRDGDIYSKTYEPPLTKSHQESNQSENSKSSKESKKKAVSKAKNSFEVVAKSTSSESGSGKTLSHLQKKLSSLRHSTMDSSGESEEEGRHVQNVQRVEFSSHHDRVPNLLVKVEELKNRLREESDYQEVRDLKQQIQDMRKELENGTQVISSEDEIEVAEERPELVPPVILLQAPPAEEKETEEDSDGEVEEIMMKQEMTQEEKNVYEQLHFDRTVRRMLAEGQSSTYDKAELAAQLMKFSFQEEDSIAAAEECSSMYTALRFLRQECELCAERYPMGKMVSMLHCTHRCCYTCAENYFTFQIKTKNIREMQCPFCKEPDLEDEQDSATEYLNNLDILLKSIVDEETHELFQRKLRDWTLMKDPNFKWCKKCSSGFISNPRARKLICPDCRDVTCSQCRRPWEPQHDGISCDAFEKWKAENNPESQAEGVARHLAECGITCPKCRFTYALAKGGCMHFTCTECKFEFCSGCSQPFRQGTKCNVGPYCERLGLHAHHPRNCLFYLRDKDPAQLESLLKEKDIPFDKDPPPNDEETGIYGSRRQCLVQEQKDTIDGLKDDICGRPVLTGHGGLCRLHYTEHLVEKVNSEKLDPVNIFDEADLRVCLRRNGKAVPVRRWESEKLYREKLIKLIKEQLPLT